MVYYSFLNDNYLIEIQEEPKISQESRNLITKIWTFITEKFATLNPSVFKQFLNNIKSSHYMVIFFVVLFFIILGCYFLLKKKNLVKEDISEDIPIITLSPAEIIEANNVYNYFAQNQHLDSSEILSDLSFKFNQWLNITSLSSGNVISGISSKVHNLASKIKTESISQAYYFIIPAIVLGVVIGLRYFKLSIKTAFNKFKVLISSFQHSTTNTNTDEPSTSFSRKTRFIIFFSCVFFLIMLGGFFIKKYLYKLT